MKSLDEIVPVDGIQDYLLREWIGEEEFVKVARSDGKPDVYHDGTYDWYGGFARFVQPTSILEIGFYRGFSMIAMLEGSVSAEYVLVIDDCSELGDEETLKGFILLKNKYPTLKAQFIAADSTKFPQTFQIERQFDLIHIDGDHSFEGCLSDLRRFAPCISDNGLVIIHDTNDIPVLCACTTFLEEQGDAWEYREIPTVCGNIVMRKKA